MTRRGHYLKAWGPGVAAFAAVSLCLVGCSSNTSGSTSHSAGPYLIGYTGPLSGANAALGDGYLAGLNTEVAYLNKHGGVNGRQVKVIAVDDQGTPQGSIAALRNLAGQGVVAIVGIPVSSDLVADVPTIAAEKTAVLTFSGGTSTLVPAQKYLFEVNNTGVSSAQSMAAFTESLLRTHATIAIGPIATPVGTEWGNIIQSKWAPAYNLKVLHSTVIPLASANLTPEAEQLIQGNPAAILVQPVGTALATLTQEIRSLGYTKPIITFYTAGSADVYTQLKDENLYAMGEVYGQTVSASGKPGLQQYRNAIEEANAQAASTATAVFPAGYVSGVTVMQTLSKCGESCDSTSFENSLEHLSYSTEGLTAATQITYSPTDHQGIKAAFFYHWNGTSLSAALNGQGFPSSIYDSAS